MSYRTKWYSDYPDIYTYGVFKFVLTIYYPNGKVERLGEYDTWYKAYDARELYKKKGIKAEYEITKERVQS